MKKIIFFLILLSIVLLHTAVITVDNNPDSVGDYTTLLGAHDAANDEDTIYVLPSVTPYSAITVTKRLSFYGVGFDLEENPGNQASNITSKINGIMYFQNGSEYSQLEGFDGNFNIHLLTSNITIKKNKLDRITINSNNIHDILIIQNKLFADNPIYIPAYNTHGFIYNNIIETDIIDDNTAIKLICEDSYWIIINNILKSYHAINTQVLNTNAIYFANNIIIEGFFDYNSFTDDSIIRFNMSNEDQLPEGYNNIENIDMNTVFNDPDGDFHLLPGSPAVGAGENGVDMGIYGGVTPYIDGGIPGIPSIFEIQSSSVGLQQIGLDVIFKAKSNKD